jgi:putative membrane protein
VSRWEWRLTMSWKLQWIAWGLVALIALEHIGFMFMEMFRWPAIAMSLGGLEKTVAEATKAVGKNQGLYNGFLAAGLIWSLRWPGPAFDRQRALFFVGCVLIAGVFGGFTVNPDHVSWKLLGGQAGPALLALFALMATRSPR